MRHNEWGQSATDTSSRRTRARGVATPLTPCVLRGCAPRLCLSGSANSRGADLSSGARLGVNYGLIRSGERSGERTTALVADAGCPSETAESKIRLRPAGAVEARCHRPSECLLRRAGGPDPVVVALGAVRGFLTLVDIEPNDRPEP